MQDFRHALRTLARSPGFVLAAVATLALGIGANTAIFSVVYGVLVKPLPFPNSGRIVEVREQDATGRGMNVCDPNFADFKASNRSLSGGASRRRSSGRAELPPSWSAAPSGSTSSRASRTSRGSP
jgi:putative ABC transport system permease protein